MFAEVVHILRSDTGGWWPPCSSPEDIASGWRKRQIFRILGVYRRVLAAVAGHMSGPSLYQVHVTFPAQPNARLSPTKQATLPRPSDGVTVWGGLWNL